MEMDHTKERIVNYWGKRSESFIKQRRDELHHEISGRWLSEILPQLPDDKEHIKILDIGCGSGYFTILLAKEGYQIMGVDLTPEMIETANILKEEEQVNCEFQIMDAEKLDFPDGTFDVIITRNLTWTLPHPEEAYEEWLRVLKPDGILLNFDADYGKEDCRDTTGLPEEHAHNMLGKDMNDECQNIKELLSISFCDRPAWDLNALIKQGLSQFYIDTSISSRIYTEVDEFYNPTPLFMLRAQK